MNEHIETEVLVIGSGPGGAVTAALLAEGGRAVAMIEEGPDLPLESCPPFSKEEMLEKYRAGGLNPALGSPKVPFVEGRCVGGGSEVNSGLYHRVPPEMLAEWAQTHQLAAASYDQLAPHFAWVERELRVGLCPGITTLASRKLQIGADALGWRAMEVPRTFAYDGSVGPDGAPLGKRQSMSKTFVPRAVAAGVHLHSGVRALRLRRAAGKWDVDVAAANSQLRSIRARSVFVCGGAVQTPALLRRSGITRNVGNTLALHPTVKAIARFPEIVNHQSLGVPVHQVKEFAPKISFGCSISSPPYLALGLYDHPSRRSAVRESWESMAVYYAALSGPNTGVIRTLPGLTEPIVRYPLSNTDMRDLATGLKNLCRLLFAAGAVEIFPSVAGLSPFTRLDDLNAIPESLPRDRTNLMTIHLFCSCPMGEDQSRCAVDSFGQVHGAEGLYVNDASLLCSAPSVNPQGSVMAFARRNALHFLGA